jgi:thiamine biosynthesis lipoprotein
VLALALAAAVVLPGAAGCREESRLAMGCTCSVRVCGLEERDARAAAAAALDEIDRVDRLLSHYRADSPLSRLNREAARAPVPVDREMLDVLALCLRWSRETDGAFDVTVGPLMAAWGFFRGEGRVPTASELAAARARVGARHVVLDAAAGTVLFDCDGISLDLGGIGKGYAVDRAVAVLRARGVRSALVNAGGSSVYGLGAPPAGNAWSIDVEDPGHAGRIASTVRLRDRALSVSGRSAKAFERDGVVYAHVMDPRTGRPVPGVAGVVVESDDATTGDVLGDALFVLGVEAGRALLHRLPGVQATIHRAPARGRLPPVRIAP